MKILVLITALLTCGGCVESTFCLSRGSALPQGLRADDEAMRVATTCSRIELWLYSLDPPTLKFFAGPELVLSRQGRYTRSDDEGFFGFFVSFNGVESTFRRVASNVVAVEEGSDDRPPTNPLKISGSISPREGLAIATETKLEVVVRRYDPKRYDGDQVILVRALPAVRRWPESFQIAVKWPAVPEEGQKVNWKASPPVLIVSVRGLVAGQLAYISEPQWYTVNDSMTGQKASLTLVPTRESTTSRDCGRRKESQHMSLNPAPGTRRPRDRAR